jgi:GT2 family glycosyltransferase
MHTGFWCRNLMERNYLDCAGIDERKILKWILQKYGRKE